MEKHGNRGHLFVSRVGQGHHRRNDQTDEFHRPGDCAPEQTPTIVFASSIDNIGFLGGCQMVLFVILTRVFEGALAATIRFDTQSEQSRRSIHSHTNLGFVGPCTCLQQCPRIGLAVSRRRFGGGGCSQTHISKKQENTQKD